MDEHLHDFDIFHLAHLTELLHYIDPKYLSVELGGSRPVDLDTWMVVQQNVDAFTLRNAQHLFFHLHWVPVLKLNINLIDSLYDFPQPITCASKHKQVDIKS